MDRLTDRRFASEGFYQPKSHEERLEIFANIPSLEAIYERLAEYEETGLTPKEIEKLKHMANKIPTNGKRADYDDDIGFTLGWLCSNGEWCTEQFTLDNVTHWQQIVLPEK